MPCREKTGPWSTLFSKFFKIFLLLLIIAAYQEVHMASAGNKESICYGTSSSGRLENGVKLPPSGPNFKSYSKVLWAAGRTYVHSSVATAVVNAFETLEKTQPGKKFVYGETGWKKGGKFKPHKTHQNGLSVDFMVPVVNKKGDPVYLPTHIFNKYGYALEFDRQGGYEALSIDFDAMAAHIKALHMAAEKLGIGIRRVIFAPELQPFLFSAKEGAYVKAHIKIPRKKSWVRHDEHYHVDFKVTCR